MKYKVTLNGRTYEPGTMRLDYLVTHESRND